MTKTSRPYQERLNTHLRNYKVNCLGISGRGECKHVAYDHILPADLKAKNILPAIEQEFWDYFAALSQSNDTGLTGNRRGRPRLHPCFAHLNSSQALAINLFSPFRRNTFSSGAILLEALRLPATEPIADIWFEEEPDKKERTNFDVVIRTTSHKHYVVEVKLSEHEFGSCKDDARLRSRLAQTYRPRLLSKVAKSFLEPGLFAANYQLLRYVSYLDLHKIDQVRLLFPDENNALGGTVKALHRMVTPQFTERISSVYLEDLITSVFAHPVLDPFLRRHFQDVAEKYLPV